MLRRSGSDCRDMRSIKRATWFIDETYVRVSGQWMYRFRAVDNRGQTVDFYLSETRDGEAANKLLQAALANPDNRPPHVLSAEATAAIRPRSAS